MAGKITGQITAIGPGRAGVQRGGTQVPVPAARGGWYAGPGSNVSLLWASPTGQALIVDGYSARFGSNLTGVLSGSSFTILPGAGGAAAASLFPGAPVAW